jgi:flagellar hook-length control protein FliK
MDIKKKIEVIGVKKEIEKKIHDYFTPGRGGQLSLIEGASIVKAMDYITSLVRDIPAPNDEARWVLSGFTHKVHTAVLAGNLPLTRFSQLEQMGADISGSSGTDFYGIVKSAADSFISGAGRSGHDPFMQERAELMTIAVERFIALNTPGIVSDMASQRGNVILQNSSNSQFSTTRQTTQMISRIETNVSVLAMSGVPLVSVEEMVSVMRGVRAPAELSGSNLNLAETPAAAETGTARIANAVMDFNISRPDIDAETQSAQNKPLNMPAASAAAKTLESEPADIVRNAADIKIPDKAGTAVTAKTETPEPAKGPEAVKAKVSEAGAAENGGQSGKAEVKETQPQNVKSSGDSSKAPEKLPNLEYVLPRIANPMYLMQAIQGQTQAATDIEQSAKEISRIIAENVDIRNSAEITKGEFEIKMKLSPKELGELFIKVKYNSGNVIIDITAPNEAAHAGILSRMADLRESLAARGMNLETVEVNSGNFEHGGQSGGSYNARHDSSAGNGGGSQRNNGGFAINYNTAIAQNQETARREMIVNHMKSRRLLYQTV